MLRKWRFDGDFGLCRGVSWSFSLRSRLFCRFSLGSGLYNSIYDGRIAVIWLFSRFSLWSGLCRGVSWSFSLRSRLDFSALVNFCDRGVSWSLGSF